MSRVSLTTCHYNWADNKLQIFVHYEHFWKINEPQVGVCYSELWLNSII